MLDGDERSRWDSRVLHDSRVISFWDGSRSIGKLFGKETGTKNPFGVQWDAAYIYGPDAEWSGSSPGPLVTWGRTIFASRDKLESALKPLIASSRN